MEKLFKEVLAVDRFYARIDDRDDYKQAKRFIEIVKSRIEELTSEQKILLAKKLDDSEISDSEKKERKRMLNF